MLFEKRHDLRILLEVAGQLAELVHQDSVVGQSHLAEALDKLPELAQSIFGLDQTQKRVPADSLLTIFRRWLCFEKDWLALLADVLMHINHSFHALVRLDLNLRVFDNCQRVTRTRVLDAYPLRGASFNCAILHLLSS